MAVYSNGESGYSSEVSAIPSSQGHVLNSPIAMTTPIIDGLISQNEWSDAIAVDITCPDVSQPVTMYIKNDGNYLYIAADDPNDTYINELNEISVYFDDDHSHTWPSDSTTGEGNFWLMSAEKWFRGLYGTYPLGIGGNSPIDAYYVTDAISTSSGHVQYEARIDLINSELTGSPGDIIGFMFFVYDPEREYPHHYHHPGSWPYGYIWPAPQTYGDLVLSSTGTCTLSVVDTRGAPGSTDNPLDIELNNSMGIGEVQFTLKFNGSLLTADSVITTSRTSNMNLGYNIWSDSVRVLIFSTSGDSILPGEGPIIDVLFDVDVSAIAGDSTLVEIKNPVLSDPSANPISCAIINGWFKFMGMKGDINNDGEINVVDVVRCVNIILGNPPSPTQYELWAADVNSDGDVNVIDVVAIVNIILGKSFACILDTKGEPVVVNIARLLDSHPDLINIAIDITNPIPVAGVQLTLEYDPDIFIPAEPKTIGRSNGFDIVSKANSGELTIVLYDISGETIEPGAGTVVKIPLNIVSTANAVLNIKKVILASEYGSPIQAKIQNGSLTMNSLPKVYSLSQNYPNPVNKGTEIMYGIPRESKMNLRIYNNAGQLVRVLVDSKKEAGYYRASWDGKDEAGKKLPTGIYFYRMDAFDSKDRFTTTKKMVLLQ